jgi:glycine/D-amino acid oxidase-like deaminating enzyme
MKKVDYIVVGQGLAGTLISTLLLERGRRIMAFDQGHHQSSSLYAAGIINPVTGRRFVKSWMFDTLLASAITRYAELEKLLGVSLIRQRNIVRHLTDQKSVNDWLMKSGSPGYQDYIVTDVDLNTFSDKLFLDGFWCEVTGYQVDIPLLIERVRRILLNRNSLRPEFFRMDQCRISSENIIYGDIQADHLIFCEGSLLRGNNLFSPERYLNPSKGEILKIRIRDFHPDKMIKKKYFLVHLHDDIFWFGAKDGWNFEDSAPSEEGYRLLSKFARQMIKAPYEILAHEAAIRPTIKDRRPVIGKHPFNKRVSIFNGLGTKGASLGPYWSEAFIAHLEDGLELPDAISPLRFAKDN